MKVRSDVNKLINAGFVCSQHSIRNYLKVRVSASVDGIELGRELVA